MKIIANIGFDKRTDNRVHATLEVVISISTINTYLGIDFQYFTTKSIVYT